MLLEQDKRLMWFASLKLYWRDSTVGRATCFACYWHGFDLQHPRCSPDPSRWTLLEYRDRSKLRVHPSIDQKKKKYEKFCFALGEIFQIIPSSVQRHFWLYDLMLMGHIWPCLWGPDTVSGIKLRVPVCKGFTLVLCDTSLWFCLLIWFVFSILMFFLVILLIFSFFM